MVTKESVAAFPYDKNDTNLVPGSIVTLSDDGILTRKAGSTVYKNEHIFKGKNMLNLQTVYLENGVVVCVFHTGLLLVKLNEQDSVQMERRVVTSTTAHP